MESAITVYYQSIDGYHQKEVCKDLQHAREWACYWIGQYPTLGGHYAVSDDGIGKITCSGCSIRKLFPDSD